MIEIGEFLGLLEIGLETLLCVLAAVIIIRLNAIEESLKRVAQNSEDNRARIEFIKGRLEGLPEKGAVH